MSYKRQVVLTFASDEDQSCCDDFLRSTSAGSPLGAVLRRRSDSPAQKLPPLTVYSFGDSESRLDFLRHAAKLPMGPRMGLLSASISIGKITWISVNNWEEVGELLPIARDF